jgi:uncharacterized OB-fold protein
MTTIITTCRACGREYEPDRRAIVAGAWRLCPDCRAAGAPPETRCEHCGRPLRAGSRTICLGCLTGSPTV